MGILFLGKNKKMAVRGREGSRVRERQDLETTLNVFSHLNMQVASHMLRLASIDGDKVIKSSSLCAHALIYLTRRVYLRIYNCAPKST